VVDPAHFGLRSSVGVGDGFPFPGPFYYAGMYRGAQLEALSEGRCFLVTLRLLPRPCSSGCSRRGGAVDAGSSAAASGLPSLGKSMRCLIGAWGGGCRGEGLVGNVIEV
jgi:hypothetical protein